MLNQESNAAHKAALLPHQQIPEYVASPQELYLKSLPG